MEKEAKQVKTADFTPSPLPTSKKLETFCPKLPLKQFSKVHSSAPMQPFFNPKGLFTILEPCSTIETTILDDLDTTTITIIREGDFWDKFQNTT